MRAVTEQEQRAIQLEAEREFPGDLMMQELHVQRRLRQAQVKDLPLEQQLRYLLFGAAMQPAPVKS